jgi:serine protease
MLVRTSVSLARARRPEKLARLSLELLEDRSLLSATPLEPTPLLITTTSGEVQKVLVDGASVDATLAAYKADPNVATAEVDQTVSISLIPNDPSFGSLYGLNNTGQSGGTADDDIDAPEAWDKTTGKMTTVVGIIDTGIDYTHPDLYLNVWINQGEIPSTLGVVDTDSDGIITFRDLNNSANSGVVSDRNGNGRIDAGDLLADSRWADHTDQDGNGYMDDLVGWNFVNNTNNPFDDNSHGTHVAGTIGAIGNNGVGVTGINWQVSIAALKFLDSSGSGSTSNAVLALNYATAKGIKITNNSWGGGGFSQSMFNAISAARNAGAVFVAAAGNSGSNNDTTANYPSNYAVDNVVAVAATDRNDQLASFSSYGANTVDLAAPGVSILSTTPNNTYSSYSGTSMATPHVSGAIALVWSQDSSLTYSQVISRILSNVDPVTGLNGKVASGGRLNVNKALAVSGGTDSTGPRVLSAVANSTTAASSVRLTFSEAIDPATFTPVDVTNFFDPSNNALTVTGVTAVAGTNNQFDVTFATQTAAGSYSFDVGPDVRDSAGNQMDQNNNNVLGEATDSYHVTFSISSSSSNTYTNPTVVPISDYRWSYSTITIGPVGTLSDLNVKINVSHTYDSDLYVALRGPDGTEVILSYYRGGSGDNYSNTVFDDQATTAIRYGFAPFAGTYKPDQLLSAFNGKNAAGTWTLAIYDRATYDTGRINSWSLTVQSTSVTQIRTMDAEGDASPAAEVSSGSPAAFVGSPTAFVSSSAAFVGSSLDGSTAGSASLAPFSVFGLGGDERRDEAVAVSVESRQRDELVMTTSADDALRLRQESLDRTFASLTQGVGGDEERADEWATLEQQA